MTRHRMRLVERVIKEGSCDFIVEAPTPALAAAILLAARKRALKQHSNFVTLPDELAETQSVCRWSRYIGAMFVVENSGLCKLLDEAGEEIEEIDPEWEGTTLEEAGWRHGSASPACCPSASPRRSPGC